MAMRILSACSTTHELLPAVQGLFDHMSAWHDGLPQIAKASELSHTPWDESKVTLAYIHMGHLGAITLIFRRTLSMYKHTPKDQNQSLHPAERGRLAAIFNDRLRAGEPQVGLQRKRGHPLPFPLGLGFQYGEIPDGPARRGDEIGTAEPVRRQLGTRTQLAERFATP